RRALVLALVTAIKPLVEQIKQLTEQIAAALREHPDGEIFLSLFRDPRSVVTAAELLAEIGDCRARYPPRDTPPADPGHTPLQHPCTVAVPTSSGSLPDLPATQRMLGEAVTQTGGPQGRAQRA